MRYNDGDTVSNSVIIVSTFRKVYGELVAVNGISFEVQRGEIFGLLGPNGAGKTSTLETLEGLRASNGGILQVMGVDPTRESRKLKNLIGVQLQTSGLPDSMRVDEAMKFFCAYHGVAPRYDVLNRLGLSDKMNSPYYMMCLIVWDYLTK
jgi:ABC-2 type transport system ATP-binding protein